MLRFWLRLLHGSHISRHCMIFASIFIIGFIDGHHGLYVGTDNGVIQDISVLFGYMMDASCIEDPGLEYVVFGYDREYITVIADIFFLNQ